jgi:hypothetical protein
MEDQVRRYSLFFTLAVVFFAAASSASVAEEFPSLTFEKGGKTYRIEAGKERVIVRGIRPEEQLWGPYQFPRPYDLGDRFVVGVHITDDNIATYGAKNRWFESRDQGLTWQEVDESIRPECGVPLANGDKLFFPTENAVDVSDYLIRSFERRLPNYDYTKKAEPGTFPIPDGVTCWMGGTTIYAYNADRLPAPFDKKVWRAKLLRAGEKEAVDVEVPVDWPYLTRVVHMYGSQRVLKSIFPRGNLKRGADGALWISAFSGEGHIDPSNGQYSPYYSAELFRSADEGKSFQRVAHMEYPADGQYYPYASGGFSDSDFEFMPDGSIVWFFRSNWYGSTGEEWSPMYFTRSTDMGKTWTKPTRFAPVGTLPRLCNLKGGFTLVCYARPGMFVQVCTDDSGIEWSEPLELMTPGDRSHLANKVEESPRFHDWDGACNNPELLPLDDNSALFFYSDFYYPDEEGVKRKTILCRTLTITEVEK